MFEERKLKFEAPNEREKPRRNARSITIAASFPHVSFAYSFQFETMINHLLTLCRSLLTNTRRGVGCDGGRP